MENKALKILLSLAMVLALAVMTVSFLSYRSARKDLSALKADLEVSTAAWKATNEKKLAVQKELKAAKNDLREANLTIEESEEKAASLEEEIKTLEKEIASLKK
jgi:peptidoglycan hydrolase CwlO-like protein